ncbi:endo alpha-1,4 polygalactosaminidase [Alteromonas sp. AMM-1]|uniref:endo alpha-1,4 polygalactosaminidase n=1 Tax=Alteromonas sp. AMM-1 TaxID=3394233 RepID=UPI0039A677F3
MGDQAGRVSTSRPAFSILGLEDCVLLFNRVLLCVVVFTSLNGCGGNGQEDPQSSAPLPLPTPVQGEWYSPALGTTWQWQLSGDLNTQYDVDVYDVDLFDVSESHIANLHSQGKQVICYFSAGSYEQWREDAAQFPAHVLGDTLDGWEDERWLDIRDERVLAIMDSRIELAKSKECDAVEPDNVDGYTNHTGFNLTHEDQLAFNVALSDSAHAAGLGIGLKNDLDQIIELVPYFDFAVNEQCFEYSECEALQPFINANKAVFNAEYHSRWVNDETARADLCEQANAMGFSTLVLPLVLDDSFRFSCL